MKAVLCLTFVAVYIAIIVESQKNPHKVFRTQPLYMHGRYAGLCPDSPRDTVRQENLTIIFVGNKMFLNVIAYIDKTLEYVDKVNIAIRQCKDAAEEKNCEHFQTWRFGQEACLMLEQKNMMWSPLFQAFHPKLHCPIQKGVYHLRNATLDLDILQKVFGPALLQKYFWRVRIEIFQTKMFVCMGYGLEFLRGKN